VVVPPREPTSTEPRCRRDALLGAARDEFSERGFAGARVARIAQRAGVNKQLISYHFGGKAGLYRAVREQWLAEERALADPAAGLAEITLRYLRAALADPRQTRLLLWASLARDAGPAPLGEPDDAADLARRRAGGELADDLDPGAVLLMLTGAVAAPIFLPREVRRTTGLDPEGEEFQERYADQLRRVVDRLAAQPTSEVTG
jgi:TetR/AcrR family transcriptional regulator